jgi:hypothetical protein
MITHGNNSIYHIADYLEQQIGNQPDAPTLRKDIDVAAMLTRLVGEDYDRAADVLVADRGEVSAILHEALEMLSPEGAVIALVRQRLSDEQRSLRVADLTERGDLDNAAISQLYAALAEQRTSSAEYRHLTDRIWEYLSNYAERRRYRSAP